MKHTEESIAEAWNKYIDWCKGYTEDHATGSGKVVKVNRVQVPTIGEFCCDFLDVETETFRVWGVEDHYGLSATVKRIKSMVKSKKMAALVNGRGNTTGLIFDLKANYGMKETAIQEHRWESVKIDIGDEKS